MQKTVEVPQLQFSDKLVDVPVVQVVVVPQVHFFGYGRRCDHSATSCLETVKVPQTQFIAGVGGHSSSHRDGYAFCVGMAAVKGFSAF